jgi:hypothetical protein
MNIKSIALAGGVLLSASSGAFAATVTETFTGVLQGTDTMGFFGTAGAIFPSSAPTPYAATYVFNIGSGTFSTSDPVSASLTINGQTFTETSFLLSNQASNGLGAHNSSGTFDAFAEVDVSNQESFTNNLETQDPAAPHPTSLTSQFSYTYKSVGPPSLNNTTGSFTIGGDHLALTALTVSLNESVAPVPEPSTWAMIILGFACIGVMTYRRRESTMLAT